jgi:hypothetical protein
VLHLNFGREHGQTKGHREESYSILRDHTTTHITVCCNRAGSRLALGQCACVRCFTVPRAALLLYIGHSNHGQRRKARY